MRRHVFAVVELALLPLLLVVESWCCHPRCNGIVAINVQGFCHCCNCKFFPNDDGIVTVVDAQTSLP